MTHSPIFHRASLPSGVDAMKPTVSTDTALRFGSPSLTWFKISLIKWSNLDNTSFGWFLARPPKNLIRPAGAKK